MSTLLQTNVTGSLIKPNLLNGGQPVDTLVRVTPFMAFLRANNLVVDSGGSDPFKFNIKTATGTAAVFSEGDTISTYYSDTHAQGSVAPFYIREPIAQSGRVLDSVKKNGGYIDILAAEIQSAVLNVNKEAETQLLGSTADRGVSSIIDSSATYAGLTVAGNSTHASLVTAVNGALTVQALENMHASLRGSSYGALPDFILAPVGQTTSYIRTIGPGANNTLNAGRFDLQSGKPFDAGVLSRAPQYAGMEWVEVHDLTSSELIMGERRYMQLWVHRDIQIDPLAKTNDDNYLQVSWAGALVVPRRRSFGRMTGLT